MKQVCGTCNFQDDASVEDGFITHLCLINKKIHHAGDTCKYWQPLSSLSKSDRLKIATDIKSSEDTERRHQENLQAGRKGLIIQILVPIITYVLGYFTPWFISLFKSKP